MGSFISCLLKFPFFSHPQGKKIVISKLKTKMKLVGTNLCMFFKIYLFVDMGRNNLNI